MANELRIDLTDPAMQEAFADCQPGETHTVTFDITVAENAEELVADVDPEMIMRTNTKRGNPRTQLLS